MPKKKRQPPATKLQNPLKFSHGDAVLIAWLDSSSKEGWQYGQYNGRLLGIRTLGMVVDCNGECITITHSSSGVNVNASPISIPWRAVVKIEKLPKKWGYK